MRRKISSKLTVFHKFVVPSISLIWILQAYFTDAFAGLNSFILEREIIFIVIITVAYLFLWFHLRCKEVSIEGDFLYVSNFFKEIKIPFSEIEKITEFVLINPNPVTIHLKHPTRFGKKIIFMPTHQFFSFYSSHPIVRELRQSANIY